MIRQPISKIYEYMMIAISFITIIAAYSYLSHKQHIINSLDTTIPNFKQFCDAWNILTNPSLKSSHWLKDDICATGGRLLSGLTVGIIFSFSIGLLMGVYASFEAFFKYPILFFGKIPPTAMLAVYFVLFGTNFNLYIAMIALGIFPALTMSIYQSIKSDVPDYLIFKAYTLGATSIETIFAVVVPQILPRIIENIRLMIGPALVFLIAAEYQLADVGFGYRLRIQSRLSYMNVVYFYLIILGVFGFVIDWLLFKLRTNLCRWFE